MVKYIAHRRDDETEQPLLEHLTNVAALARDFARSFAAEFAYACGMLHDVGKYSDAFQKRIRGENIQADHSTAGGQLFCECGNQSPPLAKIAAYCVMGHHGGLPDGGTEQNDANDASGTLLSRLRKIVPLYTAYQTQLQTPRLEPPGVIPKDGFGAAFFTRMVFSALVDADWLDTEAFCGNGSISRGGFDRIATLQKRLAAATEQFLNSTSVAGSLNQRRNALLRNCLAKAAMSSGLFTLTAPTGSGKTIASLAFALNHAEVRGKKRIIYIVPYNTIIEQNAGVFEDVLGVQNVLRHYSDADYDDDESEIARNKRHSAENWDYPLIVTSSVQFFESLFANKPSRCRKLHNVAESVLVFDEAQMIPLSYLTPCVKSIRELVEHYGCTAVLATATQSALDRYFDGMEMTEITENPQELYATLKRATIQMLPEPLTEEALAVCLSSHRQTLCVVNTRKQAQALYKTVQGIAREGVFHLSTTMYPAHRKRVLDEIRERLKAGLSCRVVSTSLVEAGVDLDFETVYREQAGLDSVVQAAGRCNREGKRSAAESIVYVFEVVDAKPPKNIQPNIDAARQIARRFDDIAEMEAIRAYFEQLYYNKGDGALDEQGIVEAFDDCFRNGFSIPFKTVAQKFRLIDDRDSKTVYIFKDAQDLEKRVREGERGRTLFRAIGTYGVSLYRNTDYKALSDLGAIEELDEQIVILNGMYYDECYGVSLSPEGGRGLFA